jgi:hypothetical protein
LAPNGGSAHWADSCALTGALEAYLGVIIVHSEAKVRSRQS